MRVNEYLFAKAPSISSPPPAAPKAVQIPALSIQADDDWPDFDETGRIVLEPVYAIMDYTSSTGAQTRRRVTMLTLKAGPKGTLLMAICHERKAQRSFRCDRITAFIEDDGVVIDCGDFFRDTMFIDLTRLSAAVTTPADKGSAPLRGTAGSYFSALTPELSLLLLAAQVDGNFHPAEEDAILRFAEEQVWTLQGTTAKFGQVDGRAIDQICKSIRKLRPTQDHLAGIIQTIATYDQDRLDDISLALEQVIMADGRYRASEAGLMADIESMLSMAGRDF